MTELSPARRRELRANAHHLHPVATIAGNGLTPSVVAEIERCLQAHELIKIKVNGADRHQRETLLAEVCAQTDAAAVQHIGTILVIWRERRDEDSASSSPAPAAAPARPSAKAKSAKAFAANARRTAMIQAAADKKRAAARGSRKGFAPGRAPSSGSRKP